MNADHRVTFLVSFITLVGPAAAHGQTRPVTSSSVDTRAEMEAFLSTATIVDDAGPRSDAARSWRASLDDGTRRHHAAVETADGSGPGGWNYRFNVAAYELDKALGLKLVPPSVARQVRGRPASVTWWVDSAMNELERRRTNIEAPDPERWDRQMQAVRVFDELISNAYRDVSPPLYLNTVWDNLLITRDWTIWITDHTGAFRSRKRLESPESLKRCDRALLRRLRELNREQLQRTLGQYLSSEQLDALEVRRELIVKHFDEQVASKGEAAVLYDLPAKQE